MKNYLSLLEANKNWAAETVQHDADFFKRLENVQTPEYLWIGCSDSRVPPNRKHGGAYRPKHVVCITVCC
jgi:carbonic anhydrase